MIGRKLEMPRWEDEVKDFAEGHSSVRRNECPSAPMVKLMPSGKTQGNFGPP